MFFVRPTAFIYVLRGRLNENIRTYDKIYYFSPKEILEGLASFKLPLENFEKKYDDLWEYSKSLSWTNISDHTTKRIFLIEWPKRISSSLIEWHGADFKHKICEILNIPRNVSPELISEALKMNDFQREIFLIKLRNKK